MEDHLEFFELVKTYLPKYLSQEATENLFKEISENFPYSNNPDIFYTKMENDINTFYQGDCLLEIPFPNLNRTTRSFDILNHDAVIISNTCDINEENLKNKENALHLKIVFSAIFNLSEYKTELKSRNISEKRITGFLESLKSNRISNIVYLPELRNSQEIVLEESFIQFDYSVSHSINYLLDKQIFNRAYSPIGDRVFSLSDYGFYLFIFKLSIHFSRIREGVFRKH